MYILHNMAGVSSAPRAQNTTKGRWAIMPESKHLRYALYALYALAACAILWLFIRYALPWLLPFILAFAISRLIEPAVSFLVQKARFRRTAASGLCTLIIFSALVTLTALAIGRAVIELTAFLRRLPSLLKDLSNVFSTLGAHVENFVSNAPEEIQNYLNGMLDGFVKKSAELPAELSARLLPLLSGAAKITPRFLVFFITCAISTYFISSGYAEVRAFILRQIPRDKHRAFKELKNDLISTFGKWLKAQLMLSGITFAEMAAAFLFMRIEFAILLALLIAVVDALPMLGSGTILVPWAAVSLISGDTRFAFGLVLLFAFNTVLRNILEPKLIGVQIGLPPFATLLALYIGFCAAGVLGMILFPLGLILLKQLNDKGYIRLWKS